jgi:FkbM family methyltransferase
MDHSTDKLWEHEDLKFYDMSGSDTLHWTINEVIKNDEYGLNSIRWQQGDVFIDIGANVGTTSIWLAKQNDDIQILAFEPSKYNYENLKRNIELNNTPNVIPVHAAVWDEIKILDMTTATHNTGCSRTFGGTEKIQAITLDWIFDSYKVWKCRYLKIDCEGAEYKICKSSKFNRKYVEQVGIEVHRNFPLSDYDLENDIRSKFGDRARIKTVWG